MSLTESQPITPAYSRGEFEYNKTERIKALCALLPSLAAACPLSTTRDLDYTKIMRHLDDEILSQYNPWQRI